MKIQIAVLLATFLSTGAFAQERNHEFSVGTGIGLASPAPWASPKARSANSLLGYRASVWARFHMPFPEGSWEISGDRLSFAKSGLAANTAILSIFWRFLPQERLHPVFAFGGGIAFTENYFTAGNRQLSVYKVRGGVEYELTPRLDVAAYLDHYSILRFSKNEPDMHALSPTIAIIYYFSDPQPATAAAVAPAPVVAPAPATAPAVAPPHAEAEPIPAKAKPKAKARAKGKGTVKPSAKPKANAN